MMYSPLTVNACENKAIEARKAAVLARSPAARWEHLQLGRMWEEVARLMRRNGLAEVIDGEAHTQGGFTPLR